ncbi:MAG TPA: molybdopterin molybdotransferase MoeA, partial [Hyphomicrobiaceae bacterium]|nr:molybdopterin molybdotransferase MoeA [Hyphomicrobiaceae bacterium]
RHDGSHDGKLGQGGQASLREVVAWIDGWAAPLRAEEVALADATGRVLAGDVVAPLELPPADRAAADGFALRADETVGASAYNPLSFHLAPPSTPVPAGSAVAVRSGDALPAGTDAIVRLELAVPDARGCVGIIAPVFAGNEVESRGGHAARGSVLVAAGRHLDPADIGLLALAGVDRVCAVGRPRVRCVLISGRLVAAGHTLAPDETYDANGPLLAALIGRDGGLATDMRRTGGDPAAVREALAAPGAEIVLLAGGTGPDSGDCAAAILADVGELAVHGVALRPGDSAGAGRAADVPVFLLPGAPAACLWAYELLAGRAVRRLAGRAPELPYVRQALRVARKIVSEVGTVDVCPVRRTGDPEVVEPMAPFAEAGLAAAAHADGFILVPEGSEGYPQGATVTVYLRHR